MMFQRNFRSIFNLLRTAPQNRCQPRRRHRRGRSNLGLTATFSPRNRRVMLDQPANGRRGQQKFTHPGNRCPRHMVQPIANGRRDYPGSAIGRRGHHLPASGVFFIHRHGIHAHPVVDGVGRVQVHAALGLQLVMDRFGAPAHLQPTRQNTVIFQPGIDAPVHHLPDLRNPAFQRCMVNPGQLIFTFQRCDRFARCSTHAQHFSRRMERMRHRCAVIGIFTSGQFAIGQHKATTDGIINLLQNDIALIVGRHQDHAIGMPLQGRAIVKPDICCRVKNQRSKTFG